MQRFPTQVMNIASYPTHKMVDNSQSVLAKQQVWILMLLILRGEKRKQEQNNPCFRKYQNQNSHLPVELLNLLLCMGRILHYIQLKILRARLVAFSSPDVSSKPPPRILNNPSDFASN